MNRFWYLLAVVTALGICGAARGDDGPSLPRGALGSGADFGQIMRDPGTLGATGSAPFSRGLGQIVSGWSRDGIHGEELAERIHWLQRMRAEEIEDRFRTLDRQRRLDRDADSLRDRDDRFRDRDDRFRDRDRDDRF